MSYAVASRTFLLSARLQVAETLSAAPTLLVTIVQPLLFLAIVLLPAGATDPAATTRLVTGALLTAFWSSTVWGAASVLRRDRVYGTLTRVVSGQVDPVVVVLGKGLGASAVSIAMILATTEAAVLVARVPVAVGPAGWALVGLLLAVVSGAAMSLVVGVLYLRTRYAHQLSSALTYPVFLLGGMMIPVSALPEGIQWIPRLISLNWLTIFMTSLAEGAPDFGALVSAVALTAAYLALGVRAMRSAVTRARIGGELDLY